jgi:hypothetical protein
MTFINCLYSLTHTSDKAFKLRKVGFRVEEELNAPWHALENELLLVVEVLPVDG